MRYSSYGFGVLVALKNYGLQALMLESASCSDDGCRRAVAQTAIDCVPLVLLPVDCRESRAGRAHLVEVFGSRFSHWL